MPYIQQCRKLGGSYPIDEGLSICDSYFRPTPPAMRHATLVASMALSEHVIERGGELCITAKFAVAACRHLVEAVVHMA